MRIGLVILLLLVSACASRQPKVAQPVDPMVEQCMTTDFSRHTDQQLAECKAWFKIGRDTGFRAAQTPKPQLVYPLGKGDMYLLYPPQ